MKQCWHPPARTADWGAGGVRLATTTPVDTPLTTGEQECRMCETHASPPPLAAHRRAPATGCLPLCSKTNTRMLSAMLPRATEVPQP